ncbi:MAG: hypothetical protein Q7V14_02430, partial [Coriobacteriia bacterium]|nr:hypothetical protein [Coriobacteriia bacterium]
MLKATDMPLLESPNHRRLRSLSARRAKRRQSMLIAVGSLLAVLLVASAAAYAWRGASNAAKRADASAPSKTESA